MIYGNLLSKNGVTTNEKADALPDQIIGGNDQLDSVTAMTDFAVAGRYPESDQWVDDCDPSEWMVTIEQACGFVDGIVCPINMGQRHKLTRPVMPVYERANAP